MGPGWHRDPAIVARNRLPISGLPLPADPGSRIDLDGPWRFRHTIGPAPDDGWSGEDEPAWDTIDLPASWVLEGSGIPIYTNVRYPFPIDGYPDIPLPDETGDHWRRVDVPATWSGRRIVLRIGAAESAVEVWVGGRWIGCSTDSRLPAEFDLTGAVAAGHPTTVALRVHRWSASTWLEDQDMWWMAGIHRPVVLYATDPRHLADVRFTTDRLDPDRARAEVTIAARVAGPVPVEVVASLTDPAGRVVVDRLPLEPVIDGGGWRRAGIAVDDPLLWSAERPALHRLDLVLREPGDPGGRRLDARSLDVGIRTVAVGGGRLLVNGRPVTIRGVNRHEHDAERGRVQSDELLELDGALLRAANVNAVRTAHYPNDERFYRLCDRIGLYVIDEANIETHGLVGHPGRLPADDPRFAEAFVARARRMVERDRNHPSVIAWSLGNESGLGAGHRSAAEAVREADPTRPVQYHPGEDDPLVDIVAPMYPTIGQLEALAAAADHRPVIMCEYSHAMGNSNGGLAGYWDLIGAHHRLAGGFIWDWVDQGIARATGDGRRWWAYGGDFGDEPNDRNFNLNGLVDADRRPHPALLHVAWVYRPVAVRPGRRFVPPTGGGPATIEIENRRDHRDLSDLALVWHLLGADGPIHTAPGEVPPVGPGEVAELTIELPAVDPSDGELRLRFEWRPRTDPADRPGGARPTGVAWPGVPELYRGLVAWDELPLPVGRPGDPIRPGPAPASGSVPASGSAPAGGSAGGDRAGAEEDGSELVIRAGGAAVRLDAIGQPRSLVLGGVDLGLIAARLGIWRAPTDNDDATFGPDRVVTRLRAAGLGPTALEPVADPRWAVVDDPSAGGGVVEGRVVEVRFELAAPGAGLRVGCRWLVDPGGDVAVEVSAVAAPDTPPLLRLGFELDLPRELRTLTWFGPGPVETYPDRVGGLLVDRHRGPVDEQLFPYARPQESGNHTAVRWLALTDGSGAGVLAIGDPRFDGAALPIGGEALARARHLDEVDLPDLTVLRLDAAHGGLGTASCGPGVDRRFEVDARSPIANRIVLRRLAAGADPGREASRPSPLRRRQRWSY